MCPGISGTNQNSVDDCPEESSRGFRDRLWNGPRYVEIDAARRPIASAVVPAWIGGPGGGFRSFSAFKRFFGPAGAGKHWHHIVEQTPGNVAEFGDEALHSAENLIAVEASVHARISGFYSSKPFGYGGKTVRQWLSGQSLEKQREFGLQVLHDFGVIK